MAGLLRKIAYLLRLGSDHNTEKVDAATKKVKCRYPSNDNLTARLSRFDR